MKLILKQYLASLKERDELDAILPDLLSQLGLNVFTRPGRGTRQAGVDIGAVGQFENQQETVYLFSLKAGDLTRRDWDGDSVQSLRPSLNEIRDSYIPNLLPVEHREKPIAICIGIGGDVQEQVRASLEGYIRQNTQGNVRFEEWNGDKLAELIQKSFLQEELLPVNSRSSLRKALALLDEPDASKQHFMSLISALVESDTPERNKKVLIVRQMNLHLWILFSWARDSKNLESAYLTSELTLLSAWNVVKTVWDKTGSHAESCREAFTSVLNVHLEICDEFLTTNILPYVDKLHGISTGIRASCYEDVNFKLFDLIGRISNRLLWTYWQFHESCDSLGDNEALSKIRDLEIAIRHLIGNNPALSQPLKDDQAIDIAVSLIALNLGRQHSQFMGDWLSEMFGRVRFAYAIYSHYPNTLSTYDQLLSFSSKRDEELRREITQGSILYPMLAFWSAFLGAESLYSDIASFKSKEMEHCNYQLWFPDDASEEHFYLNTASHGATLSHIPVDYQPKALLAMLGGECKQNGYFDNLSAIKHNWWPLIFIACRVYRLPIPLHFVEDMFPPNQKTFEQQP